ncbi:MAG: NAD(P)-dependent oxidoreductase [Candidatus Levybacteria bacterium]|nr:NAD(P)-dependent oxidoreductase [Candidatus Levybacteria bacterium]
MIQENIIGVGISGLVGSRVKELLTQYSWIGLSRENGFDIQIPDSVSFSQYNQASWVVLFAAKADVDACELDREHGKDGEAWKINVEGARTVVNACRRDGKKLIYISTDFVFSGDDTPENGYDEDDIPSPINWYGHTKFEAEKIIQESGIDHIIVRPAYPYRAKFDSKKDFFRAILGRLQNNQPIKAITDHVYNPTFIDDIADAIGILLKEDKRGIFHVVGSQSLSPYESALEIARVFNCDANLIDKITRQEYFEGKANRPYNLHMNNDKITKLGVTMRSFTQGLEEIKKQL